MYLSLYITLSLYLSIYLSLSVYLSLITLFCPFLTKNLSYHVLNFIIFEKSIINETHFSGDRLSSREDLELRGRAESGLESRLHGQGQGQGSRSAIGMFLLKLWKIFELSFAKFTHFSKLNCCSIARQLT